MVIHAHPRILFIHNKQQNDLGQIIAQFAVFYLMKWRSLSHEMTQIILCFLLFNAVGVVLLIAQGCQTIVQATLG